MLVPRLLEDEIYEAAFRPEVWPGLLDQISRAVNAAGAVLANLSGPSLPWFASAGVSELYGRFFSEGWAYDNAKTQALLRIPHRGFISDADHLTDAWMSQQPIYRDFYWPAGFGYAAGTFVEAPGKVSIAFSVEFLKSRRSASRGEIAFLDALRPHLARSALLAHRLEYEKAEAALQALELTGVPAAIIRADGRMLNKNRSFGSFVDSVLIGAFDQLKFVNSAADSFYNQIARQHQRSRTGRSFPLRATERHPAAILHFIPITGLAREIFLQASYFLLITTARQSSTPSAEILKGLYDLTPTEARIAARLGEGSVIAEIARVEGSAVETVRSHVKSILAKAGAKGQREFVVNIASSQFMQL